MFTTIDLDVLHAVVGGQQTQSPPPPCPAPQPPPVVVNPNCLAFCSSSINSDNTNVRGDGNLNGSQNSVAMPGSR
jgi:hypothetical protein